MMTRLVFQTAFRKAHQFCLCALLLCAAYFLDSCASARTREFALQTEAADTAHTPRPIYVTGKKPISQADPDNLVLDVWKVEDEDYPKEMRVFARVLDSSGNFITKMAPPYGDPDYRKYWTGITEILGGDTVQIKEFTVQEFSDQDSSNSFALALALDHGGSMAGAISYLQEAARMFVGMKFPNDRIAIAKFDSKIKIEAPLTADVRDLQKALQNNDLKGYGLYTALYDAMKETSALLAKTQSSTPRAMIVFSDGEDNHSKASDAEVYAFAKQHKIRIFPVGFGYANDTTLGALARSTGGKYYRVYSKRDFARVFKDIYESLRNYYQITYIPTNYNGRREGIIALDPRGKGGLSDSSDSAGRRGRGTLASNSDGNGNRGRGTLGTGNGDGSENKSGSGSQGNSGSGNNSNGDNGNGGDGSGNKSGSSSQGNGGNGNNGNGSGNKSGSGTQASGGNGSNRNGNNGNGGDGSGNKLGSGSQSNGGNGNNGNGNNGNGGDGSGNKSGSGSQGNGGNGNNGNGNNNNGGDGSGNKSGSGSQGNNGNRNNGNGNSGNGGDGSGNKSGSGSQGNNGNGNNGNGNSGNGGNGSGNKSGSGAQGNGGNGNNGNGNNGNGGDGSGNKSGSGLQGNNGNGNGGDGSGNKSGSGSQGNNGNRNNSSGNSGNGGDGSGNKSGSGAQGNNGNANNGNGNNSNGGDGSGNKSGSGSQGNNGNRNNGSGNSGNGGDGSGNKSGSGSQGNNGNGNNGNGNSGNGGDGSGNKSGSSLQSNSENGNNSITGRFEYDKSVIGLLDTVGSVYSTTKIYFDYKKAELKPESAPMLDLIAEALQRAPRVKIEVRGHTDNIGGTDFNQRLSELRAEAVVQALVQRGISQKRLQSRGLGLSFPVAGNETEEERQKNRRTEFAIIAR